MGGWGGSREGWRAFKPAVVWTRWLVQIGSVQRGGEGTGTVPRYHGVQSEHLVSDPASPSQELGNSVLGNFGLSMDNFAAVQDPETGSYSINFNQGGGGKSGGGDSAGNAGGGAATGQ